MMRTLVKFSADVEAKRLRDRAGESQSAAQVAAAQLQSLVRPPGIHCGAGVVSHRDPVVVLYWLWRRFFWLRVTRLECALLHVSSASQENVCVVNELWANELS